MEFEIKKLGSNKEEIEIIKSSLKDSFGYSSEEADNEIERNRSKYLIMVSKKSKEVISFLKTRDIGPKEISINNVVTVKKYRGEGYGTKFLDYLKNKYAKIELTAIKKNAKNFYSKNGFKIKEEILKKDYKAKLSKEEYEEVAKEDSDGIWKMEWSEKKKSIVDRLSIFNW